MSNISFCIPYFKVTRNPPMDDAFPIWQPIESNESSGYISLAFGELLSFYKNIRNSTVHYAAMNKDSSYTCDPSDVDVTTFPSARGDELIQTHPVSAAKPVILTPVMPNDIHMDRVDTNFVLLPPEFYECSFALIIVCAFISALAPHKSRARTRSRRSLMTIIKRVMSNIFNWTLAHLGNFTGASPYKTIQLALLISVTFMQVQYDAYFSNDNLKIIFPKIYRTYKQIADNVPDYLLVNKMDLEHFESHHTERSAEKFIEHLPINQPINSAGRTRRNVVAIGASEEYLCFKLKRYFEKEHQMDPWIVHARDQDATDIVMQMTIPSYFKQQEDGRLFLKIIRIASEAGLRQGVKKYHIALVQRMPTSDNSMLEMMKRITKCIHPMRPNLENYRNIDMKTIDLLVIGCSWLLLSSCAVIAVEVLHFAISLKFQKLFKQQIMPSRTLARRYRKHFHYP